MEREPPPSHGGDIDEFGVKEGGPRPYPCVRWTLFMTSGRGEAPSPMRRPITPLVKTCNRESGGLEGTYLAKSGMFLFSVLFSPACFSSVLFLPARPKCNHRLSVPPTPLWAATAKPKDGVLTA